MIAKFKDFIERYFEIKIIPQWRMERYELGLHLKKLFEHMNINTVIDVGANEGQYASFLRNEVGYCGTILSFEPGKELFQILQKKSEADPDWYCFPIAFGEENKTDTINIMARSQFNSLLKPKNDTFFQKENAVVDSYQINVSTLDDFWTGLEKDHDLSSVYLKLDTQGYDLKILTGAKESLPKIKALQSEMSVIPIYNDMPDYKEVTRFLENHKFSHSAMFPVSNDTNMRLIEFDGIFVNSALFEQ